MKTFKTFVFFIKSKYVCVFVWAVAYECVSAFAWLLMNRSVIYRKMYLRRERICIFAYIHVDLHIKFGNKEVYIDVCKMCSCESETLIVRVCERTCTSVHTRVCIR